MNTILFFPLIYLHFFLVTAHPFYNSFDARIIGGNNISIEEVPYQISLQNGGNHFCGGSIISSYQIITAAHCTSGLDPKVLSIRAGTTTVGAGGQVIDVGQIFNHPKFDFLTADYDIAVLELSSNLTFGISIAAIDLPGINQTWPVNTEVLVTGWGLTNENSSALSPILQGVLVKTIDQKSCNAAYGGEITNYMICAGVSEGGKDACSEDSGGPLQADGVLLGVVSWGNGCGKVGYPGVYANVATLRDFVREVTGL